MFGFVAANMKELTKEQQERYGGALNHYLMDRPASPEKGGAGK